MTLHICHFFQLKFIIDIDIEKDYDKINFSNIRNAELRYIFSSNIRNFVHDNLIKLIFQQYKSFEINN